MTYTPTNWIDGATPLNRANMMRIENELALLDGGLGAPGAELAYAANTAPVTVTGTSEAAANVIANSPSVAYDGAPVIVQFLTPYVTLAAGVTANFWFYVDGVSLGVFGSVSNTGSATGYHPVKCERRYIPSVASHVFSVRASGGGTVAGGPGTAGTDSPSFIRVTRV